VRVFDYIIKPVFCPFSEALRKYREYFVNTRAAGRRQKDVDRLLHPHAGIRAKVCKRLKASIPLTLRKVRQVFAGPTASTFSAEEVAEQVGVSRSTARATSSTL